MILIIKIDCKKENKMVQLYKNYINGEWVSNGNGKTLEDYED